MIPGDHSQVPVEHLAQLLLQQARQDAALAQREAANDDDMLSRLGGFPAIPPAAPLRLPPGPSDPANVAALEELIAIALTQAQDAEDLSREVGRRMRRGIAAAIAVSVAGVAIAAVAALATRPSNDAQAQYATLAGQLQAIDGLQRQISDQLNKLQTPSPVQNAGAAAIAAPGKAPQTALPPLAATPVRVLPAHVAVPAATPEADAAPERTDQSALSYPAAVLPVSDAPLRPAAYVAAMPERYGRPHHRVRHARVAFVGAWPTMYMIGAIPRDVVALFR